MFVACGMAPDGPVTPPLIVRASVWIGKVLGQWDLRRRGRRGDAFVAAWKSAWSEGCDARWQGIPKEEVPHRGGPAREAWLAGWLWAVNQPNRRMRTTSIHQGRRASDSTRRGKNGFIR